MEKNWKHDDVWDCVHYVEAHIEMIW
jgi:hypothetical protein